MAKPSSIIADGRPTTWGWLAIAAAGGLLFVLVLAGIALGVSIPLPDAAPGGQATEVLAADGKVIGAISGEQRRKIVPLAEISPFLQKAAVATEDRTFYQHSGISFRGIARALTTNVGAGGIEQGGSTITQQYARNAFQEVGTERSIFRKIREIGLAAKIERRYPKDRILEFYLNTIYFGRGAYGAEAASLTYFKKPAKDLTLSQAAYLAGVIRSPERFQVDKDPTAVLRIRNEVLNDMVRSGYITPAEAAVARADSIIDDFKLGPTRLDSLVGGFFIEHIRRMLLTPEYDFTEAEVLGGGLKIHTTLDLRMQQAAEQAIATTLTSPTDPEAALVSMDAEGNVLAMVGGREVADPVRVRGFNYAANARPSDSGGRQAGSAFKPFALAA
ncbi:MAG: transglycosylase domain-containing protein, partial [Actinomycetota bacterium]|nr:transglycosylase domain-containing protein [Actinomycetota bacterium]